MSHLQNQSYLDRRQKASLIFGFDGGLPAFPGETKKPPGAP
jgi:hypothetical protein